MECVDIPVSVFKAMSLQFKATRWHLSLHFSQFSFIFAVNLNAQLNQFNYKNLEMLNNQCTYSRLF